MKEEKYIASEEGFFVRRKIMELCKDHCFDLTPQQVDAVLELSKEYKKVHSSKNATDVLRYALETIQQKEQNLLVIELENETSVPKVFYKGEEITGKIRISFDWETDTSIPGGCTYLIEHGITGEGYPLINTIERRIKGHACN